MIFSKKNANAIKLALKRIWILSWIVDSLPVADWA